MKVFLNYEECLEEELKMKTKVGVPQSWVRGPAQRLLNVFVEAYNKKHPESPLDENEVHFVKADGFEVPFDAPIESVVASGEDLFLKSGPSQSMSALNFTPPTPVAEERQPQSEKPRKSMAAAIAAADAKAAKAEASASTTSNATEGSSEKDDNKELCRRFGCNKRFNPSENTPHSCKFHSKPPVFHETRKYWACCPDKIGWDWNSFQAIEGCCVGEHSTEMPEGQLFQGGTDVRKELEEQQPDQNMPQKLGSRSSFEKLSALRRSLIDIGVDAARFDTARDKIKASFETGDASAAWDHTAQIFAKQLESLLQTIASDN